MEDELDGLDPLSVIQRLGGGTFVEDVVFAINSVSGDVVRIGKNGTVTVTFAIKPASRGAPTVIIDEKIKMSPPVEPTRSAVLYAMNGQLYPEDPRQAKFEFRIVESPDAEVRRRDAEPIVRSSE